MTEVVFYIFAAAAVISAALCILQKSPIAAALWLVSTMFSLAAIYVLLNAQFIAAIQVLVYAGAVMVLFLFVIMLLNAGRPGTPGDMRGTAGKITAVVMGGALIAELFALRRLIPADSFRLPAGMVADLTAQRGAVEVVADPLFHAYLVPFEITSLLLLAAVVGAVVLAKRKL